MKALLEKIRKLLKDRRFRQTWYRFVSGFAALVVFITTYALVLPAITIEKTAACGIEEHQHDESCYESRLICGQEESDGHHHDDSCYTDTGELVCDLEESEGHSHTDACYEKVLVCGKESHIHSTECYKEDSSAVAATDEAADGASTVTSGGADSADSDAMPGEPSEDGTAGMTDMTEETAVSDPSIPQLDPVDMDAVMTKDTGFYYFHAEEGDDIPSNSAGITDWQEVKKDTKLSSTDLVKAYFAYKIPAASLNESNPVARYRLPGNLHLTDEQIEAINLTENGIYTSMEQEAEAEAQRYLGAEAVEGDRKPDEELVDGAQEYISAVVRAENIFDEEGSYLGQDLIFTFVPYTIEKNQNTYDADGSQLTAGEKITGWFACDFNMSQIDWVEEETDLDNSTAEKSAEVVFVEEDRETGRKEISTVLNLLETDSADNNDEPDDKNSTGEDSEDASDENATDDNTSEGASAEEAADAASAGETASDAEEAKAAEYKSGTLTADGEGYRITLDYTEEAKIPENAELSVKEITAETDKEAYEACLEQAKKQVTGDEKTAVDQTASRFFDIEILVRSADDEAGESESVRKIEPAAPVSVNIQITDTSENTASASESGKTEQNDPTVLHFAEEGVEEIESTVKESKEQKSGEGQNTEVQFEAGSFSIYGVVYTVDFHWEANGETYDFSLPGGGFVSFYDLVEALGIEVNETSTEKDEIQELVDSVESIEFSNPDLVSVSKVEENTTVGAMKERLQLGYEYSAELTQEQIEKINAQEAKAGDWALISLKPFDSEESLTVTMKNGDTFTICVTDANVAKEDVQDGKGYIIFTRGSDNNYYVLKADGTTQRFDNADGFDELTNEYKWTITHVYTEDELERFNIHSYTNPAYSLALNNPGRELLTSGANNIIVDPSGDGYKFTGFNNTMLGLVQDGDAKKFAGVTDNPAEMYFYEQAPLSTYKFTVTSNDIKRGKLVGKDNVGVMQGETQDCAQYTAGTTADKKNQYTIKAVPQSNKYIFDHWELNGETISAGSTINPEELDIPYNGSNLEAIFKVNPDYNPSDDEKEGQGFDDATKEALQNWLNELKTRQVPLNPDGCKKTAEVYDYDNRVYRVDLTAQSSLTTFDGTINLGFIMDVSGSMQFPSKLSPVSGKESYYINQINDNWHQNDLDHDKYYYLIADKAGTATVYRLFYGSQEERTWYGTTTRTGWWAVDASYQDNDSRHFFIGSDTRFANDAAGMYYQIYTDGDYPHKRLDYLISSVNGSVRDLRTILDILALAGSENQNPDVKIAYNTFYSSVNTRQHQFISATDFYEAGISWATNGGTATDAALADARDFEWGTVNSGAKNYAILITDGAPQAGGKAIANQTVINQANELKKGPDGVAGTSDDVTLMTVGLSMGDVKRGSVLLYDLANRDSDNEKMFFKADSGDELEYALYQILQKIMVDASVLGKVTDTVGEAFYPVDLKTGVQLTAGNVIDLDGNLISQTEAGLTNEQKAAGYGVIQEDGKTIVWNNQEFTHDGWRGTVYVKAKEDFLGGNAVRTNSGEASIEAKSYKTPSMTEPIDLREKEATGDDHYVLKIDDLASPLMNVNELQFTMNDTDWTVYLGTEVDPEKQLEALYKKILVEQKVTAGQDLEPEERDNLKDHVTGGKENYLYPLKQSISDKRESEIEDGKTAVTFTLNDLLKKLAAGKNYSWWDYDKGEPKYEEFFEAASTGAGIILDYDEYGINEKLHQLDDDTTKQDGSTISIKLTKVIKPGELDAGVDPLDGAHPTKITGDAVEKYTLTVLHTPDYEILPEGQGGKSIEDFHVGGYATMYQGHAAGTETSTNVHTINVYTKPLEVKKVDPDEATLPGAKFGIYRPAETGETGVPLSQYNSTLTGSYVLVSEGTSDGNGLIRLADTGNTAATLLVPNKNYILIETKAPEGYERDDSVHQVQVTAQSNGLYTDLKHQSIASLEGYEDPYNWSQGVRIAVDGKVIVAAADAQSGSDAGERELGANEKIYKADPVVFRTTIINKENTTTLDVTKSWTDEKGENKAEEGYNITFKVTRKAGLVGEAQDVSLTGHVTAAEGVSVNNDGSLITLTYRTGTGWPTARLTGLEKYTDSSMQTEWIYEVSETICNPKGKVDPTKAKYKVTENNGIKTITIVNIEKKPTQIKVDKKWFGADGNELAEAPENSITFEVYRVAHIPCIHDYANQNWVTETEPTCTTEGSKYRECSKCHEKEYETIPANGHNWSEWSERTPATYLADGEEYRICSVCHEEETRPITKLPHDHVFDELSYITEPTCTQPGTAHKKCLLCGELDEATIEVPAYGHSWNDGVVTKRATCEEAGIKTYTCTRDGCGATETRDIEPLGHDWVSEDDPAATCLETGTRKWTCRNDPSHHDAEHPTSETIDALGHLWGEWETQEEATATTEGINIRYCLRDHNHFETQTVPKTGETFGNTGLPVSPYEWPTTIPAGKNGGDTTTIETTGGIIKYNNNYYIIHTSGTVTYTQLTWGPEHGQFNDYVIKLTGIVKTKSDVNNTGQLSVNKGDLYKTEDGEYYACKSTGGMVNVNQNNPDASVKNDTQNWYHIPKQVAYNTHGDPNNRNNIGRKALRTSPKAANMRTVVMEQAASSVMSGESQSGDKGPTRATDENAERKARIAALTNTTPEQIIFRSELGERSNVDAWEYLDQYTGSGTNWQWVLENLDAYDDDGNEYTYYVVETAPDESLYEISYENNGLKDSDTGDTITIKNKQKVGSVEVTKTFAGLPADKLPSGFKITATYTVKGQQSTVELTPSTEGVTGNGTTEPYKWTIGNLPIGTVVTFTESGYEVTGYTVVTNPAADGNVVSTTATATETPGQASFLNTYTQVVKVTLDILKIEKDHPGKKLPNATFTLREINSEITASEPSYKDPDDSGITATTNGQGEASFNDIEPGYYEIRETGVPAGYVITGEAVSYIRVANGSIEMIKVNAARDGWDTVNFMGNFEFNAASGTDNAKVTVSNVPGAALPSAGGHGTNLIYLLGIMLTGLAGAGLLIKQRRKTV